MSGRWCERGEDAGEIVARKEGRKEGRKEYSYYYSAMLVGRFREPRVDGEEIDEDSMIER